MPKRAAMLAARMELSSLGVCQSPNDLASDEKTQIGTLKTIALAGTML